MLLGSAAKLDLDKVTAKARRNSPWLKHCTMGVWAANGLGAPSTLRQMCPRRTPSLEPNPLLSLDYGAVCPSFR